MLHPIWLLKLPSSLFWGHHHYLLIILSPPQFPCLEMVPLSLFHTLSLFFIHWLIQVICLFQNKMFITDLFFRLNLSFLAVFLFPLLLLMTALLHRKRCLKVLLTRSVTCCWRSMLTPLGRNIDTSSYFPCVPSLNLRLSFLLVLLYCHPSLI